MAKFVIGAAMLATLFAHTATAHADTEPDETIAALADEAGVDETDLAGALLAQPGIDPRGYLIFDGKLAAPVAPLSGRLACIAWHESRNDPRATNPRSKAAGLFQFLWSTWAGTPQGRAGESPYDAAAATAAAQWMIGQGRVREWVPVQMGLC
jgi:hypothetical protein